MSNHEQVGVCLHWVSDTFEVREECIDLHVVESIDANTLVSVIKDVLLRLNLSLNKDGAVTTTGLKSRVAKQLF